MILYLLILATLNAPGSHAMCNAAGSKVRGGVRASLMLGRIDVTLLLIFIALVVIYELNVVSSYYCSS